MPRQLNTTRLAHIIAFLPTTITLLSELHYGFGTPFVRAISNTTISLLSAVQNVKRNKEQCVCLLTNIHEINYAIVMLYMKSKPPGSIPPAQELIEVQRTLHKILMYLEAQQDGNGFKHLFRQSEMSALLNECHAGLKQALEVFKIETTAVILSDALKMQEQTQNLHKELLELISNESDGLGSDKSSSIYHMSGHSQDSSGSFGMLPGKPKIFHGREAELAAIMQNLNKDSPRIAILGPGGIGKTSLAKAVLHNPDIHHKYSHRLFVACDSATTHVEIAALVELTLGLKPAKDLTKVVVQYFSNRPPSLLVLDNLETSWETIESRNGVEEFLSLLTDVKHLALIITMRGVERPAKVRWTRPLVLPLKPLSNDAAWKTFLDITDNVHEPEKITRLLQLTDNMPLAVNLIAHLVDYEDCSSVLHRWKTEKTALLSHGYDKISNLDSSIAASLSSPRMTADAKQLLSLLSILPDGLSDVELTQSNLPLANVLSSKVVLVQVSLAYIDNMRLKVLVPIREHMLHIHPPALPLVRPLRQYFHALLDLYEKHFGRQVHGLIDQITSNLGNLHHILLLGLYEENPDLLDTIHCTITYNYFRRFSGRDRVVFMDQIQTTFLQLCGPRLGTQFITEVFYTMNHCPISNPERLLCQGESYLSNFDDPLVASRFYAAVGGYHLSRENNPTLGMQVFDKALALAKSSGSIVQQARVLVNIAVLHHSLGNYRAAQKFTREAQQISQLSGNLYSEAVALNIEARCCGILNHITEQIVLCQKARRLLKLCALDGGSADSEILNTEAHAYWFKSEYAEACSIYSRIVHNTSAEKDPWQHAVGCCNIADIGVMTGMGKAEVHVNLDTATKIFKTMHYLVGMASCDIILADLHLREKNHADASVILQNCLKSSWGVNGELMTHCLEKLADFDRWNLAGCEWSYNWTILYLVYVRKTQQKWHLHKAIQFMGDVYLLQEDGDTATTLFTIALEGFQYVDVHVAAPNACSG